MLPSRLRTPNELAEELMALPRMRRLLAAGSHRRYRDPALVDYLVKQCFEHRYGDPDKMLAYAETAVAAARRLPTAASASDSLCRAYLHLSNTHRRRGEFDSATSAIEQAKTAWASGSQKASLRAEMLWVEGGLLHDLRRIEEAVICFRTAAEHYRSIEDVENCASALINEGMALVESGDPQQALVAFFRALTAIDDSADKRLRISALQCFCWALCEAGQYEQAHLLSRQCSRLFFSSREPGIALRIDLLNAQIDDGLGHWPAAEHGYQHCREGFEAAGMVYEQALATLHLAALLAGQGRTGEVRELCNEVFETFDVLGVPRESTAAALLRDAIEFPRVELLKAALHYMEREVRRIPRSKPAG